MGILRTEASNPSNYLGIFLPEDFEQRFVAACEERTPRKYIKRLLSCKNRSHVYHAELQLFKDHLASLISFLSSLGYGFNVLLQRFLEL
jgi:hypothetical protein